MDMDHRYDGFDELEKQIASLDLLTQKRVQRKTLRESSKPIESAMHQNVRSQGHVDSGVLDESIKTRVSFPKNSNYATAVASIGVFKLNNVMAKAGMDPKKDMPRTMVAYWLEHGVQPHYTGKGSNADRGNRDSGQKHPGIPAQPFIRPAFDQRVDSTLILQKSILAKEIDRAIQQTAR